VARGFKDTYEPTGHEISVFSKPDPFTEERLLLCKIDVIYQIK